MTTNLATLPGAVPSPTDLRTELERLIVADLLGPAGGPDETLPGTERVRDRYLVGMLAPKGTIAAGPERQDDPGSDVESEGGDGDPLAAAPALFPSSIGLSSAVVRETAELKVTASWGLYVKEKGSDPAAHGQGASDDGKGTHWQRYPMEGSVIIPLRVGRLDPVIPVPDQPGVLVHGHAKDTSNAWLVDLFLVNEQETPKVNRDQAWLFQPVLTVESTDGTAIFIGRREAAPGAPGPRDPEEQALDLIYRHEVEFAVGHGTGVHCTPAPDHDNHAVRVETAVLPSYEVGRVEAPTAADHPLLAGVELDMKQLAESGDGELAEVIGPLATAYAGWLDRQEDRINAGDDGIGRHQGAARESLRKARETLERLRTGIALL